MDTYKEFVDEANAYYRSLPIETNEIYKKYYVNIKLDGFGAEDEVDINKNESETELLALDIAEKTKIKFNAIISDHSVKSFDKDLKISDSESVGIASLTDKMFKSSEDKLAAFSNANSNRFIFIELGDSEHKKVNLLFVNRCSLNVQVMVKTGKKSDLTVLEFFASASDADSLVTALHETNIGEDSNVEINMVHNENDRVNIVNLYKARLHDRSKLKANFVYSGGCATKTRTHVDSDGIDSNAEITEFAFGAENQRFDISTAITNKKRRSAAILDSGAVLDGSSQCMLKGFAKVENGTKGCLSRITERGILLSKDAHIDALPDMSIDYSDEVKATHSAATSPIDEDALFYLQSRGLEEKVAKRMFIIAFVSKYVSKMNDGISSEIAMSIILDRLEGGIPGNIPGITANKIWKSR